METGATINTQVSSGGTITTTVENGSTVSATVIGGGPGPQGQTGATGATGATGQAGPNQVTSSTATTLTGILKGNGSTVGTAVGDTDFQNPITLTTTGSSGAATFSGDTLNIPQYSGGGGGMTNPMTTLGDIIYENATPAAARLAGSTSATKMYLSQTGTGSVSAAPSWAQPAAADLSNGTSGTGNVLLATSPTLTTPTLGVASATSVNKVAITAPASSATLTIANTKTLTISNTLTLAGTDSTTMTFPSTSATIARTDAANTFTGHQTIEGVTSTGATGTGNLVFATSPTLTTPNIGAATAGGNLTLSTYNIVTDTTTGTKIGTATTQKLGFYNATPVVQQTGDIGTGLTTLGLLASPTLSVAHGGTGGTSASITLFNNITGFSAAGTTGTTSTNLVFSTSPTLTTPNIGAATAGGNLTMSTYNIVTDTTTGTIIGTSTSQKLGFYNTTAIVQPGATTDLGTVLSSLGLRASGTAYPMTTSGTVALTGTFTSNVLTFNNHAVSVSSNAGTCSVSYYLNTFTNSSAATMAITIATSGAVDGQRMVVRVYDYSAVAETIGWTNTENSTVSAPTTSNGSTTLPLSVAFIYNGSTSKWRCVAVA